MEQCDDGKWDDFRGCKFDCSGVLPEFECEMDENWLSVCKPKCGDGLIWDISSFVYEECDDMNTDDNDGCSSSCLFEEGWLCSFDEPTTCTSICGDGIVVLGEICDTGNTEWIDGCNSSCTGELPGWHCSGGSLTSPSTCAS